MKIRAALLSVLLLTSSALAAPKDIVSLDGAWQVRIDPADADAVKAHPKEAKWFKAQVPGSVQQDLLAAGRVPDPFIGINEAPIQWAGLTNWQFRRTIDVTPAMLARDNLELVFEGLDTFATVTVNGTALLSTDNAHRRWRVPVKQVLKAGENEIIVSIASPIRTLQPKVLAEEFPLPGEYDSAFGDEPKGKQTSPYIRKPKYQYGWDWGPRLVNIGVWQPVSLEVWDDARVDTLLVHQEALNDAEARLLARYRVVADKDTTVTLTTSIKAPDGSVQQVERTAKVAAGVNEIAVPLTIDQPQRWWPVGYGAQPLYTVSGQLGDGQGTADKVERRIGLRTSEFIREKGSFGFKINGVEIFAKGANLIPFDNFPARVTDAQMRDVLESARDANMNMIRVWGGGYYLHKPFYDMADELGIMIWQDFMFGGAVTPPDAEFRHSVKAEAEEQVERLQAHASVVGWAGNNEVLSGWENWSDRKAFKKKVGPDEQERVGVGMAVLFDRVLRDAVLSRSPGIPYWPGSPSTDFEGPTDTDADGDRHFWDVWSGSKPVEKYLESCPRFMSEYGFQAMPDMATIRQFAGKGDLAIDSPVLKAHQKFLAGEGNARLQMYLDQRLRPAKDFADLVYLTQANQALAIEMAARHHRACRPVTLGSLYWQLNDTWPAISWASMDYYGRWKLLHYAARRFFAPQAIATRYEDGVTRVSVVSDATQPMAGTWRIRSFDMGGNALAAYQEAVTLAPLSATEVAKIADADLFRDSDAKASYAVAELIIEGKTVSRTIVERALPKDMSYPAPGLKAEWEGKTVTITAGALARVVMLDFGATAAQPSDDGFDLLPGEAITIDVRSDASAAALKRALTLRTLGPQ